MKSKISIISAIVLLVSVVVLNSCRKDRVPQDDYQNMDSFYDDHEEEEQEYTIDSSGNCPLVCKKGTKICVTADMFEFSGGGAITYPFQLKVIELYSIKDMILRRVPSVASGNVLETSAEIKVRAFKNGTEVFLKPGRKYFLETAVLPSVNSSYESYYGYTSSNSVNWTNSISSFIPGFVDTLSTVMAATSYYTTTPATTGWFSPAKLHQTSGTTTFSCTVAGTNTQNIQIYISFTGFKGVMRITNLTGTNIPLGENVKFIAFGKKQNNQYVMDVQTFNVTANQQIPLNMQNVSETDILNALAEL
jgi:hypothetical protein